MDRTKFVKSYPGKRCDVGILFVDGTQRYEIVYQYSKKNDHWRYYMAKGHRYESGNIRQAAAVAKRLAYRQNINAE